MVTDCWSGDVVPKVAALPVMSLFILVLSCEPQFPYHQMESSVDSKSALRFHRPSGRITRQPAFVTGWPPRLVGLGGATGGSSPPHLPACKDDEAENADKGLRVQSPFVPGL